MTPCEFCGQPIPPREEPRGRPAKYCSQSHREMAFRARKREREREFRDLLLNGNPTRSELIEAYLPPRSR